MPTRHFIKINKSFLCLSTCLALIGGPATTSANELIKGFAQWQADRVEKIALDQAIFSLMEDQYVQAFFPDTTEAVNSYGGSASAQRLIPLIKVMIDEDIERIEETFTVKIKSYLGTIVEQFKTNDTTLAMGNLEAFESALKYNPETKDIPAWYKNFVKIMYEGPNTSTPKIFTAKLEKVPDDKVINIVTNTKANNLLKEVDRYNEDQKKIGQTDESLLKKRIDMMIVLINQYEESKSSYDDADDKKAIIAIHFFVRFFELFGSDDQNYTQFKSLGLFLAALIEAKDSGAVAAVLDSFVDEQVAYRNKRIDSNNAPYSKFTLSAYNSSTGKIESTPYTGTCKLCTNTLFVGSYFGGSLAYLPDEETLDRKIQIRAFGPVGIEYKIMSYYGDPITINFAPLDLGNYISNELRDIEYTARFSDIVAPSIFLSYSFKERPFSVMIGYQKDVKIGNLIEDDTFFLSFAFDLPIYTIY
jgi:hypothetical protein